MVQPQQGFLYESQYYLIIRKYSIKYNTSFPAKYYESYISLLSNLEKTDTINLRNIFRVNFNSGLLLPDMFSISRPGSFAEVFTKHNSMRTGSSFLIYLTGVGLETL